MSGRDPAGFAGDRSVSERTGDGGMYGDPEGERPPHVAPPEEEIEEESSVIGTLLDRLTATEPDRPLAERGAEAFGEGGWNRVLRGFQKVAGTDGTPAIMDIALGLAEIAHEQNAEESAGEIEEPAGEIEEPAGEIEEEPGEEIEEEPPDDPNGPAVESPSPDVFPEELR